MLPKEALAVLPKCQSGASLGSTRSASQESTRGASQGSTRDASQESTRDRKFLWWEKNKRGALEVLPNGNE